jgi:NAD(P)-dependent dehydrogenase (short-subunit alcohol dehydrogenase family)
VGYSAAQWLTIPASATARTKLTSGLDIQRFVDTLAIGTTKAGVIHLTKVTTVDLAPVRCNCFAPGVIETPLSRAFLDTAEDPAAFERAMLAPN